MLFHVKCVKNYLKLDCIYTFNTISNIYNNKTDEYDDECVYTCIIVNNFHIITFIYIYDTIVTFVTSICILLRYRYIYRYILFVFTTTILF